MPHHGGYGCPGPHAVDLAGQGGVADPVGGEGRHGSQDGTQVPVRRPVAVPTAGRRPAAGLADAPGPVRRRVGRGRRTARTGDRVGGQDPVRGVTAPASGPVRRRTTAHLAAAGQALAGDLWAGQGGVLRPGPSAGPAGGVRLHAPDRAGGDDPGAAVRPPGLPLRADALELGARHALFHGELRELQRRLPERGLGPGRCAGSASQRPHEPGRASLRHRGVHPPVRRLDGSLRGEAAGDQCRQGARERRRRAEPPPVQAGAEAGPAPAGQPRLPEPGRVRGISAARVRATEQAAGAAVRRRPSGLEAVAGAPARVVPGREGARAVGQHDHRGTEHLLGAGPPDRREGGRAGVCRHDRGVVRPTEGGRAAASARPGQAPRRLPARDRVAGAQAGCVRRVSLPGRVVSDEPLSPGLRPTGGDGVGTSGPGLPGASAPGSAAGRGTG